MPTHKVIHIAQSLEKSNRTVFRTFGLILLQKNILN